MKFVCLTLLIISGATGSRSEQYEVVGAADPLFAVAGEDVILPCSVKPNISVEYMRVEWFRPDLKDSQLVHLYEDHEDRNTDQIQSFRGRTELNHQELQRGDASLKLSAVQVSDEGRYKCFIRSKSWSDDATVDFKVEAVGHPPVITVDGFDDSGGLHLQCESEGWYPEPDLEWLNSEGVSLSSETTETHRNTDGFSVKHTISVHHSDKFHCRVKLRHHMLETQIITTSNMIHLWRTLAILFSIIVVLSGFAAILIAVYVHKYREIYSDCNESMNSFFDLPNIPGGSSPKNENFVINYSPSRHSKPRRPLFIFRTQKHNQLQTENRRIKQELNELLQNQKIPKVITHLETDMGNATLDADSSNACLTEPGKEVINDKTEP